MRGDQLALQWGIIRAIEASPNRLTDTEIAQREDPEFWTIHRDPEAPQLAGFLLYSKRFDWSAPLAFIDTFKFKPPLPFTVRRCIPIYSCKYLVKASYEPITQNPVIPWRCRFDERIPSQLNRDLGL